MFHVLVIFAGILFSAPASVTLTSNSTYSTIEECKSAMSQEAIYDDILVYYKSLVNLGYSDLSIQKYECIAESNPT
jgi:hypothetical protein